MRIMLTGGVLAAVLLGSTSPAALAGEVVYAATMSPAAIAVDRANRAELLASVRPTGINDVWCYTQDYRYGKAFGANYLGSDPDPNIRGYLLAHCSMDGGDAGTGKAAGK
jgi:hypothetical protein